jgi:M3 family oligoendopeptidase
MTATRFQDLPYQRPDRERLAARDNALLDAWDRATTPQEQLELIYTWDRQQRDTDTYKNLASIRFTQDTRNADYKTEKNYFDDLSPELRERSIAFMRRVVTSPHRPAIEDALGRQAIALWELALKTFEPSIADLKRRESDLINQYDELMASIRIDFQGQRWTLSTLRAWFGNADRATRLAALHAQDQAVGPHGDRLSDLYHDLTQTRHLMATTLGYDHFTPLGYANLGRTDYGPAEVDAFRAQVREHVLPLVAKIHKRRALALGVDHYDFHDEGVADLRGAPQPHGDHAWILDRASEVFKALGHDFDAFFSMMRERDLMDLQSREGKVGGGYCEALPNHKVPFIFSNFNGSQSDISVLIHECGHAFQLYTSREQPLRDYLWPTLEACEIHSMGLEFLALPHMDRFFEEDAERFRTGHIEGALLFIPYGVTGDSFQHRVYNEPHATPERRAELWREEEALYLPHRTYQGMPYFQRGLFWQRQAHLFHSPFYYIDYCLAQVCALQLWMRAEEDREATMATYRQLCALGGSLPFTRLLDEVGLDSPFKPGCVERVVQYVERTLNL